MAAAPPAKSINKVLQRVGVYGFGGSSQKRCKYEIEDDDNGGEGTMEMMQIGADRPKNVLILMSDTGGGHRASAEAIRDAFRLEFGDEYEVIVKDVWKEYTGWPLNDMERSYKFMVKHVQLWKVAFHSTSPRWVHSVYLAAIAAFYAKFHPAVNRCYCPSEEVAKRALLDGLEESQLGVFGLPIRPSFCRAVLVKDDLRVELEMDPELPAVLLMGGGEGMGPVKKTAKALGESLFDKELEKPIGQLIVICGRNKDLASTLLSLEWKIPVKIRGFETQMEKWMGACDCIITKAGPGTIAEALIRGLPIILNDYIPGQEKGNVPYVVENGAGVFSRSPKETARLVAEWFSTKTDELKRMSENALKLAQPEAVFNIVKDIHELSCQRGPLASVPYELTASFSSLI
ncbi:probable monogalactosyldiacylglycerol synthase 3, chloroplastic isoform X2 [Diospyros lotus]|uniref:probable monogalactosyldiacylglycerol synthase 3, chloroplastic isoform X2 n=1 Tax=Diospyros lotus TaxID=55363 RepID=UPI00225BC296|nr:probable monogalactosyldiacylglycerol synthase 3, chloroplastic isoform X2 [Diospyros lotus]